MKSEPSPSMGEGWVGVNVGANPNPIQSVTRPTLP